MIVMFCSCFGGVFCIAMLIFLLNKVSNLSGIVFLLVTRLSLCNTQARAVNLIHAVLCDDEGVTQARGC